VSGRRVLVQGADESRRDKLKNPIPVAGHGATLVVPSQRCHASATRQEELMLKKSAWEAGEWKYPI